MDLDTAIDMVRELGTAWKTTGAPHQRGLGEAMLLVAYAAQLPKPLEPSGWPGVGVTRDGRLVPVTRTGHPLPGDPFLARAKSAETDYLKGKPAPITRLDEERTLTMPLDTAEGEAPTVQIEPKLTLTRAASIEWSGLAGAGSIPPVDPQPAPAPRRLARKE